MLDLMVVISRTYDNYERDRQLIDRAMEISSNEMIEANKLLEEQATKLQRSNQELKEFAFAVSHDLKEPLRTIASYIQLTQNRIKDKLDQETIEFMSFAVSGVKRLQTMLDGMLRYAQVNETHKEFSIQDLDKVMGAVQENLKEVISANGVKLLLPKKLPVIRGNFVQLVQLFQNLFANSVKFRSDEAPYIQILLTEKRSDYLISILDNGIGVQANNRQELFTMFKRGHQGNYDGVGMGLSICKKIVENHGGTIRMDDKTTGGARIDITLPRM